MTDVLEDVAFSPSVKAEQRRRGSRDGRERTPFAPFRRELAPLAAFLSEIDTAYLATTSAAGQPYAQHRGGPKGFIKLVDATTLGFADYAGNRQYVTTGNLAENDRAFLFLMDYAARRRIKLWGRARMVDDEALIRLLMDPAYAAAPERALIFSVTAWDVNCPRHIPQKVARDVAFAAVEEAVAARDARIAALEQEVAELRARESLARF